MKVTQVAFTIYPLVMFNNEDSIQVIKSLKYLFPVSHELQTCDWPRNVGCDGLGDVTVTSPGGSVSASVSPSARVPEQRVRYTVVPTDVVPSRSQASQPAAVVSSRGQSRQQLQHSHTHSGLSHSQVKNI